MSRSLPLGLKRYMPGIFEKLHGFNSGILTASQVSALWAQNRFFGRYALGAHIAGQVPLPEVTSKMARRGRKLQGIALEELADEKGWQLTQLNAYAAHPEFDRLIASPDALHWCSGLPAPQKPRIGEVKVVAKRDFDHKWQDGPPLDVELQHQCQYACTGAESGFIVALVIGPWDWEIKPFETLPNPGAMAMILDAAKALFAILDAGKLPPPDDHQSSLDALHRIYPATDRGKIVSLTDEEAGRRFAAWQQATLDRKAAKAIEKASQDWFFMRDPEAGEFRIGNDKTVTCQVIQNRGSTKVTPPYSYRRWDLKQEDR